VDVVISHPFNPEVAATPAREFVSQLKSCLGFSRLVAGPDFALGRGREGDISALQALGAELGYTVDSLELVQNGGEKISSSQVRQALREGAIDRANSLLGRPYSLRGEVVRGDGRGRSIGIPTANLNTWTAQAAPKPGVYVCRAYLHGETWGAVSNIGVRPTFETGQVAPRVEAHLLDFDRNLYGQVIRLEFLSRLRDEQRFPNVQALIEQIHSDIARGREYLREA
jgi:riboflavin kinase/FMN adenylyltransferase